MVPWLRRYRRGVRHRIGKQDRRPRHSARYGRPARSQSLERSYLLRRFARRVDQNWPECVDPILNLARMRWNHFRFALRSVYRTGHGVAVVDPDDRDTIRSCCSNIRLPRLASMPPMTIQVIRARFNRPRPRSRPTASVLMTTTSPRRICRSRPALRATASCPGFHQRRQLLWVKM